MDRDMDPTFDYETFTSRNIGFVSHAEQARLRRARVLVTGVGGMGGAVVGCLARAGVGGFVIADIDRFEVSNLNRQMFATLDVIGREKTAVTRAALARVNPDCEIELLGADWTGRLPTLLPGVDLVINGCDDVRASLALMRAARQARRTVIDAFASTLPNVCVVRPDDPRPEQLLGYPTVGLPLDAVDDRLVDACKRKEIEWVLTHSGSARYVDLAVAAEMISGARPRISFAPMVWMTGCLMAYEALRALLGRPGGPGPGGYFIDPWRSRVERNRGPLSAFLRGALVRRFLYRLAGPQVGP
jgi:molybdopterin/thiamine biosynthesis adenylyltransferase